MKRILFGKLEVEVDDRACEEGRWRKHPRHPETLRFLYKQLLKIDSPVMLDIGAGQGRYALLAKFVPGMRVFCWEPNPEAFQYLESNVRLNDLGDRVKAFRCGLWDVRKQKTLHVPRKASRFRSATIGDHPHKKTWKAVKISVRPLDDFQHYWNRVDLIKLDVEGAEWFVLRGGKETIRRWRPKIWMECAGHAAMFGQKKEKATDLLREWRYRNFEPHPPHDVWIWP